MLGTGGFTHETHHPTSHHGCASLIRISTHLYGGMYVSCADQAKHYLTARLIKIRYGSFGRRQPGKEQLG
jgi:hypothetical protein